VGAVKSADSMDAATSSLTTIVDLSQILAKRTSGQPTATNSKQLTSLTYVHPCDGPAYEEYIRDNNWEIFDHILRLPNRPHGQPLDDDVRYVIQSIAGL
jgi:hypothetical protein